MMKSEKYRTFMERMFRFIRKATKQEIIDLLGKYIQVTQFNIETYKQLEIVDGISIRESKRNTVHEKIMKMSSFFHQAVVLIDGVASDNDDDIEHDLREWIVEELYPILCQHSFQNNDAVPLYHATVIGNDDRIISYFSSIGTKPRHELTTSIANPEDRDDSIYRFTIDMKMVFTAFNSRVIQLEEWFQRFVDAHPLKHITTADMVQRFAFCLYQMMLCGLIVRSRRKENLFEKAALVWASP